LALNCTISPAIHEDARHIAALSERLIETGLPKSWTARRISGCIRHRDSVVLTARADKKLIGFAIMRFADDAAHLNLLAVEPAFQRSGIGQRLVAWLEESAIVAGTFMVSLEVRADNTAALGFYNALGYQETGTVSGYYSGLADATLLARDLRVCKTGLELE
jgi:ribosomal-protein-alanine N-acetyltransferase